MIRLLIIIALLITIPEPREILQLADTPNDKCASHIIFSNSFWVLKIWVQALDPEILSKIPVSIHQRQGILHPLLLANLANLSIEAVQVDDLLLCHCLLLGRAVFVLAVDPHGALVWFVVVEECVCGTYVILRVLGFHHLIGWYDALALGGLAALLLLARTRDGRGTTLVALRVDVRVQAVCLLIDLMLLLQGFAI